MKRKTTHADGRVEEVEGTAEEIAQLDARPHACTPCALNHYPGWCTRPHADQGFYYPWWQPGVVYGTPIITCDNKTLAPVAGDQVVGGAGNWVTYTAFDAGNASGALAAVDAPGKD